MSLIQVSINVGILASYLVGIPYQREDVTVTVFGYTMAWWRVMVGVSALPPLLQVGC